MPLILYGFEYSPAVRSVNLVIHQLGLEAEFKVIDLSKREHLSPEFSKLNPFHTVPVIDDDGFILWESKAIMTYLASKYAKDDSLYPKDLQKRAIVDQRLHYSNDVYYVGREISRSLVFGNKSGITEDELKKVQQTQDNIEKLLEGQKFMAGDHLTLADFAYVTMVDVSEVMNPSKNHPLTKAWFERCKSTMKDFEKVNKAGADQIKMAVKQKLGQSSSTMPLIHYGYEYSPAVRTVNLIIHELDLQAEFKVIDLTKREHLSPEFIKMNPLHTVPVIDDDGFILWESKAIICYLASKYAKDDSLYPKDLQKRAIVDQRLHYSNDVFYVARDISRDLVFFNKPGVTDDDLKKVQQAQDYVEKLLEGQKFMAGENLTLADYSYVTLVDVLEVINPSHSHPLTKAWFERCKTTMKDFEKVNKAGADQITMAVKQKLAH
ncbi:uncharacterized protein LOC129005387 [Macrosteles quadrilineatus]|uniref:uncharacterized protein LOC129005387 n=1 Tax=Macrosteles quadrilineatus TaxID=74068 RepID=UPI0023E3045E|nr:uncharacterized protein LOC129005387 [Macrosteles quadrilineatus]